VRAASDAGLGRTGRPSFCEQKEAKKLYPFAPRAPSLVAVKGGKVFWFFFQKKNNLADLA
jgi:hypothetical protein